MKRITGAILPITLLYFQVAAVADVKLVVGGTMVEGGSRDPISISFYGAGNLSRTDATEGGKVASRIYDKSKGIETMIDPSLKTCLVVKYSKLVSRIGGTETVKEDHDSAVILGHQCDHFTVSDTVGFHWDIWATRDFGDFPVSWTSALPGVEKVKVPGLPLRLTGTARFSGIIIHYKLEPVSLLSGAVSPKTFDLPAAYAVVKAP